MLYRSVQHVRNRLDAAVRMPWKTREVVLRPLVPEIIQKQKGIELVGIAESERPVQADARSLDEWLRFCDAFNRS